MTFKDVGTRILDICQRNVDRNNSDTEPHGDVLVRGLNWHTPFSSLGKYVYTYTFKEQ